RDREVGAFRQEIADLAQERLIGGEVGRRAVGAVPVVDLRLQGVARGEQRPVLRREVAGDGPEPGPERLRVDAGARQGLAVYEVVQLARDLKTVDLNPLRHSLLLMRMAGPSEKAGAADRKSVV